MTSYSGLQSHLMGCSGHLSRMASLGYSYRHKARDPYISHVSHMKINPYSWVLAEGTRRRICSASIRRHVCPGVSAERMKTRPNSTPVNLVLKTYVARIQVLRKGSDDDGRSLNLVFHCDKVANDWRSLDISK